jgi:hypothetical protein
MKATVEDLKLRREMLITRAAVDRLEMVGAVQEVKEHFTLVNEVTGLVRALRRHPVMAGLLTAGAASVKLSGWGGWVQRAWSVWKLTNTARSWFQARRKRSDD